VFSYELQVDLGGTQWLSAQVPLPWEFDITTGVFVAAPEIKLAVYPGKVDNGIIYVGMGEY
jgi:hypothetical protein